MTAAPLERGAPPQRRRPAWLRWTPTTRGRERRARRPRGRSWLFSRLSREGRALLAMASLSLIVSADIGRGSAYLLPLASVALLAAALLVSRAYRMGALGVALRVPPRVALGEELCITLELENGGASTLHRLRAEAPALPRDGQLGERFADVEALPAGARTRLTATARFAARGAHHVAPVRVAALVPLGLAQGRARETAGASFLVVPRIARVTALGAVYRRRHQPGGVPGASRTGDASDLAGVRQYRPGDAPRDLHARSWARHGEPMVRQYQEEYFTRIGVVVDTSASGEQRAHLEAALSLAAGVVAKLSSGEALVDVLVAGERAERLSLGRHLASLERALDMLAAVEPTPAFDATLLVSRLDAHLGRLSSLVFVALDWDAPRAAFVAALEARGVAVTVLVIDERAERTPRLARVPLAAILGGQELTL